MKNRKEGYYWVKIKGVWGICRYSYTTCETKGFFIVIGGIVLEEHEVEEVDEKILERNN